MKKVRFTEEQMVTILREADKNPVAEVAKKHKISEQTIYVWRRRFGKLEPADVKRLRELESENAKLKRMVAEREMAIETLKEIGAATTMTCGRIRASITARRQNFVVTTNPLTRAPFSTSQWSEIPQAGHGPGRLTWSRQGAGREYCE